ncbi:Hypothetical predicted protein [Pelobates cultripes]|uniref:Endonuclease/exonuclease/phosphatase domain-containing protein n=1 Tax=Pelobates cultripes TaxID=61616 RepID=A0AAD1WP99_PELCU|nr:Hypothetical predicted protein [Pelobates cultripes]
MVYTIATIYTPNRNQASFLRNTLHKLEEFTDGILLVGGDFNAPLDPALDSSSGHSCLSQRNIKSIRQTLDSLRLVDCWRTLNPSVKDYTYYSALHDHYSRIDYLFITQEGLSCLHKADIEPATWSDNGS